MVIRARAIERIVWNRVPDRVEPGEAFDIVVRVFADEEDTTGQPITFYLDGEPFFTTTGADIEAGDFSFDGRVNAVIDEPGTHELRARVAGVETEPHYIGVGEEPDPSSAPTNTITTPDGGLKPVDIAGGAVALGIGYKLIQSRRS